MSKVEKNECGTTKKKSTLENVIRVVIAILSALAGAISTNAAAGIH